MKVPVNHNIQVDMNANTGEGWLNDSEGKCNQYEKLSVEEKPKWQSKIRKYM